MASVNDSDLLFQFANSKRYEKKGYPRGMIVALPGQVLRVGGMDDFVRCLEWVDQKMPTAWDEAFLFAIDLTVKKKNFDETYRLLDLCVDVRPSLKAETVAKVLGHLVMHGNYEAVTPVLKRYILTIEDVAALVNSIRLGDSFI